jgi:hypothetical protein
VLTGLDIPQDFRERVENAVRSRVENEAALKRMERFERSSSGLTIGGQRVHRPGGYFQKRMQMEREIESLRPIDYDDLQEAADLIRHFRTYWSSVPRWRSRKRRVAAAGEDRGPGVRERRAGGGDFTAR